MCRVRGHAGDGSVIAVTRGGEREIGVRYFNCGAEF